MVARIANLHVFGKKKTYKTAAEKCCLNCLGGKLFLLKAGRKGEKDFSRNQAKSTFSGTLYICSHSFLQGLPAEVTKSLVWFLG